MKYSYKPETKRLLSFMKRFPPIHQRSCREKIMLLFRQLFAAQKQWIIHKTEILNTKQELTEIYKPDGYNFIPKEIREKIENDCSFYTHYSYSFTILSRIFKIHFMCSAEINHTHVLQKMERIYMWFQIACKQNPDLECSKTIQIYLYCIHFPKRLPNGFDKIDMVHANTAFTTGCQTSTDIVLFREEEWFKVLMHESFHNLGLDFIELPSTDMEIIEQELRLLFHIEHVKDIRFYETYCEIWAEIMNVMFVVYFTRSQTRFTRRLKIEHTTLWKDFKQKMMYETLFSCFQCAKIMRFNGIRYADFIGKEITPYQENTYVFSYYILKSILIFDYPGFLDFADTMKFKVTLENAQKYLELITRNYKHPIYLKTIENMENDVSSDTLRMTLFEI